MQDLSRAYTQAQVIYSLGTDSLALVAPNCAIATGTITLERNTAADPNNRWAAVPVTPTYNVVNKQLPTLRQIRSEGLPLLEFSPTRSILSLQINAPNYNHAVGVVFDHNVRTFRFFDSSFAEYEVYPQKVISLLEEEYPEYLYVPSACEANILPQKSDPLCTMWSYFLLSRACAGMDIRTYLGGREYGLILLAFYMFLDNLYSRFVAAGLYLLYEEYQRVVVNLLLNKKYTEASTLLREFRMQDNKREYLRRLNTGLSSKTQVTRTYYAANFLIEILFALQYFEAFTDDEMNMIRGQLRNETRIDRMIEILMNTPEGEFVLLTALNQISQRKHEGIALIGQEVMDAYITYLKPYEYDIQRMAVRIDLDLSKPGALSDLQYTLGTDREAVERLKRGFNNYDQYEQWRYERTQEVLEDLDVQSRYLGHLAMQDGSVSDYYYDILFDRPTRVLPPDVYSRREHTFDEIMFLEFLVDNNYLPTDPDLQQQIADADPAELMDLLLDTTKKNQYKVLIDYYRSLNIYYNGVPSMWNKMQLSNVELWRLPKDIRPLFSEVVTPVFKRLHEFSMYTGTPINEIDIKTVRSHIPLNAGNIDAISDEIMFGRNSVYTYIT